MKILYTASSERHIRDNHLPILEGLRSQGHTVHVPAGISYAKGFLSLQNIKAFRRMRALIRGERYDLILTHTALAGFITRMAIPLRWRGGAKRRGGSHRAICIHTAHGYLFGKGTRLSGKLTYPFERLCAGRTDAVFTMNAEDAVYARKMVRKGGRVIQLMGGMGADLKRYTPVSSEEKIELRRILGLPGDRLLVYAAEFSPRKNHAPLIRAMATANAHLLLAGDGKLLPRMQKLAAKLGLGDRVKFLGYVPDTALYLRASDAAVSPSLSEGLPVGVMEALAAGLPVAASDVKGHRDLLAGRGYPLFDPRDGSAVADALSRVLLMRGEAAKNLVSKEEAAQAYISAVNDIIRQFP